jgi:hypothetical protein
MGQSGSDRLEKQRSGLSVQAGLSAVVPRQRTKEGSLSSDGLREGP